MRNVYFLVYARVGACFWKGARVSIQRSKFGTLSEKLK